MNRRVEFSIGSDQSVLPSAPMIIERMALGSLLALLGYCALRICGVPALPIVAVGGVVALSLLRKRGALALSNRSTVAAVLIALTVIAAIGVLMAGTSIERWDARSIWFFHAKVIFYQGSLFPIPEVPYQAHFDYPALGPFLAADLARLAGFWNEYLPKFALIFLLMPALLVALALSRGVLVHFVLIFWFVILPAGSLLWNGLMDGYLAIYSALAVYALIRVREEQNRTGLWIAICSAAVAAALKQEGMVVLLLILAGSAGIARTRVLIDRRTYLVTAIALLGPILWRIQCVRYGVESDLGGIGQILSRAANNTSADSLTQIWRYLVETNLLLMMALGATAASLYQIRRRCLVGWIAILFSLTYLLILITVYLGTPYDLAWHLHTSAARTFLAVAAIGSIPLILIGEELLVREIPKEIT